MDFTLQTIKDLVTSELAYVRGERCYYNHAIARFKYKDIAYDEWQIYASVKGSSQNPYSVFIHFVDNQLDYMDCDCKAYKNYDGACKHIVCTLLRYFDEHVKQGATRRDGYAHKLIEIYTPQYINAGHHIKETVKIYPTLHIDDPDEPEIYLSLKVGVDGSYVVKDILQFVSDILDHNQVTYGKNLSFVHHMEAFDEGSQKIIRFVRDRLRALRERTSSYYTPYVGASVRKRLSLNEKSFVEFIDMMQGRLLDYETKWDSKKGSLQVKQGNPPIILELKQKDRQFVLGVTPDHYTLLEMYEEKYVLLDEVLYHCTPRFAVEQYPLLNLIAEKMYDSEESKLFFKEEEMKQFCASVLPKIQSILVSHVEDGELERYIPDPLKVKLYLDSENRGIVAKVDFYYGELPAISDGIVRDIPLEVNFINELQGWGFQKVQDNWYLKGEEEVYLFLTKGLDGFFSLCEVNVTEAVRGLKVISSPIASIGIKIKNDLLSVNLDTIGMSLDEVMSVLGAYRERKKYYRLKDGSFVNIEEAGVSELAHIIDGLGLTDAERKKGQVTLPKYRALYLDNIAKSNKEIKVDRDKGFKQIVRDIKNVEDADYEVPEFLSKTLRNYQKTGYRWLKTMAHYEFGGILADDMGLGKTLQVIALFGDEEQRGQSIVVCPTSLVLNWRNEVEKFAPHIKVQMIQGDASTRKQLLNESGQYDVLLTSYELLKRDIEEYDGRQFCYIIADEAQYIKNHNTQNAKALKKLQGKYRFALTGTPIENSLAELWSIFDFVMPGYLFGYSKFKKQFESPIVKDKDPAMVERLQKFVAPFIIRRLKKDVLKELPEKIETVIYSEMEAEQERIYKAYLAKAKMDFTQEIVSNGFAKSQIKILSILMRLRQICCHPGLFLEDYDGASGKMNLCLELIEDSTRGGHCILLFSQFTSMLSRISKELENRDIPYLQLTGSTPTEKRMALVDEFNKGETPVFLISLKAGGTGLNLTAADIVIHYDPWWNLSAQNQATDRAYRIGQKKNVQVFQLITKDSIEEKIQRLQERKKDLTESVIKEGETFISKMSQEDVLDLFERG